MTKEKAWAVLNGSNKEALSPLKQSSLVKDYSA
jgi:hypothetical protein